MRKWLARRFKYTRELAEAVRELKHEVEALYIGLEVLEKDTLALEQTQTTFSKMTLRELETVMAACVDYHKILNRLKVGDSVQPRILPIFEKYNVKIERNVVADDVSEEDFKEIMDYLNGKQNG